MGDISNGGRRQKHSKNNPLDAHSVDKDNLGEAFEKNIRPFIEVIDTLRKNGLQNDIKLPNVVVVGDQSSGKSSIIEAISGVQLPRGRGIVTRCPLELQLKRMHGKVEWKGTLFHNGRSVSIERPEDVEKFVILAQNEICGGTTNISEDLLTLRIESNSKTAPELTLIDLPGIARTAVIGQDRDICERILKMIETFIDNENTVILCMVSANLDVAVNDALRIAEKYDPQRERTIGVITKPDLAEGHQKEAALQLLNNQSVQLKKGFRMVKCRSEEELKSHTPLSQSLANEMEFFKNDKYFKHASSCQLGTMNLANKITEELVSIIKKTIPQLKEDIKNQLEATKKEIDMLPNNVPLDDVERRVYLNKVMHDTQRDIESLLTRGNYSGNNKYLTWRKEHEIFQKKLIEIQRESISTEFSVSRLQTRIRNERGREICGFLDYSLFEELMSNHIHEYKPMAMSLLKSLNQMTEDALLEVVNERLGHLPEIKKDVNNVVTDSLESCGAKAEENLELIFDEEKIPFSMDSVFQTEMRNMSRTTNNVTLSPESNASLLASIIECYLKIVLNRLCDVVPMTIRQWIQIKLNNMLQVSLMRYMAEADSGDKVMEKEESRTKRASLIQKLKRLEIAKRSLNQY